MFLMSFVSKVLSCIAISQDKENLNLNQRRDRKTDMYSTTTMLICFQNFKIFRLVVERSLHDSYITIFSVVLNCVSKTYRAISHSRLARNVLLPLQ